MTMDASTRPKQRESATVAGLQFPHADYPASGTALEVADGIFWMSTPVPFVGLKQVNVWLIRDGDGFTMIDCGYGKPDVKQAIAAGWDQVLGGAPLRRLIVTHFHPDHAGNSGWICEKWGLRPRMSHGEWLTANLAVLNRNTDNLHARASFYLKHGLDNARAESFIRGAVLYSDGVTLPPDHKRLRRGDILVIGEDRWKVIIGEGHSPEHVSLYCAARKILIAGDQLLPNITTNVSTWQVEPEFDAVGAFLATCKLFKNELHPDTHVLPSHRRPFRGVRHLLHTLDEHHAMRLNLILEGTGRETCGGELLDLLFLPGLDGHQVGFAMGESIAHLNHLVEIGFMELIETKTQAKYRRLGSLERRVAPELG
jgi:glyoxylase-like metal-dependent hydrolase (beta-lactamase superfamily II)